MGGGGNPDMEFFLMGLFGSVSLVLWGTALLATYIGLKLSKSTSWNPKLSVVSKKSVSAFQSMHENDFMNTSESELDATGYWET